MIGHACVLLEGGSVCLLSDPWLFGRVFNESWSHLSPPAPVDWSQVTHVWISHEHPDHFHVPTLRAIPAAHKERIEVLYQRHVSRRVVNAISSFGFPRVRELPLWSWTRLDRYTRVLCGNAGVMDSFLAFEVAGDIVLNLNDCLFNRLGLRHLRWKLGRPRLLLTQFSFATWVGNSGDEIGAADAKLDELSERLEILEPAETVPFASFVTFCSLENARMNDWVNTPERVHHRKLPGLHFLYPGDTWDSAMPPGSSSDADAIERYRQDGMTRHILPTPPAEDANELVREVGEYLAPLRTECRSAMLDRLTEFEIFLHDLAAVLTVRPRHGTCELAVATAESSASARYVMCSQAARFMFRFPNGFDTILISGMYQDRRFHEEPETGWYPLRNLQFTRSRVVEPLWPLPYTLRWLDYLWQSGFALLLAHRPEQLVRGLRHLLSLGLRKTSTPSPKERV